MQLVHLQDQNSELVLSLDKINYVNLMGDVLFVYFSGDSEPLQLRDGMADAVWRLMRASCMTIHLPPNKKAETHDMDGFS